MTETKPIMGRWVIRSLRDYSTLLTTGGHHTYDIGQALHFVDRAQAVDYIVDNNVLGVAPYEDVPPEPVEPIKPPMTPIICVEQSRRAEMRQLVSQIAGQLHAADMIARTLGSSFTHTDRDNAQRLTGFGVHSAQYDYAIVEVAFQIANGVCAKLQTLDSTHST